MGAHKLKVTQRHSFRISVESESLRRNHHLLLVNPPKSKVGIKSDLRCPYE
jgi:hypothetical protein